VSRKTTFVGYWDGKRVAEALDLKTLAKELRGKGIDPTKAEIRTQPSKASPTGMGLRTRPVPS
jgi:hypothetical protein